MNASWLRMNLAGIRDLPGPAKVKRLRGVVTADDLVNRKVHKLSPNELMCRRIRDAFALAAECGINHSHSLHAEVLLFDAGDRNSEFLVTKGRR